MFSQTLLIDADDTLWENNIYFERAIASFISFLNHHEFSPEQVREVLNDVERECIVTHGYGLHSFGHALIHTFERLSVHPVTPELQAQIRGFAHSIQDHPIELLPEVRETLHYLSGRHRLILMTKGAIAEQSGKIERLFIHSFAKLFTGENHGHVGCVRGFERVCHFLLVRRKPAKMQLATE